MKSISFYTENRWKWDFFWCCHLQSNVICVLISLILVRWKQVKMPLPPPPDLHLGNPRLGPPRQNQVYTYQINTLLYKHIMTCFWLVFIKIVQLESHTIIGYQERSFLAVLFFLYRKNNYLVTLDPLRFFIFIVKDRKLMHFEW